MDVPVHRRVREVDYSTSGAVISSNDPAAVDELFGYTARDFDTAVGLQYNRARWYDPNTGRWLSQDPIGFNAGDANLYRYVGNTVTGFTDPNGLLEKSQPKTAPSSTNSHPKVGPTPVNPRPLRSGGFAGGLLSGIDEAMGSMDQGRAEAHAFFSGIKGKWIQGYLESGFISASQADDLNSRCLESVKVRVIILQASNSGRISNIEAEELIRRIESQLLYPLFDQSGNARAGLDDLIDPDSPWYHGTDPESAMDIINNGLSEQKLRSMDPVDEGEDLTGIYVTRSLTLANGIAAHQCAARGHSDAGVILVWLDREIGDLVRRPMRNGEPAKDRDDEMVIPFHVFPIVPRPRSFPANE